MIATYALEAVVAAGNAPSVRWLQKEIRAGRVTARKIGRHWRMTAADVSEMLDARRNTTQAAPPVTAAGLSPRSRRRLRGVA